MDPAANERDHPSLKAKTEAEAIKESHAVLKVHEYDQEACGARNEKGVSAAPSRGGPLEEPVQLQQPTSTEFFVGNVTDEIEPIPHEHRHDAPSVVSQPGAVRVEGPLGRSQRMASVTYDATLNDPNEEDLESGGANQYQQERILEDAFLVLESEETGYTEQTNSGSLTVDQSINMPNEVIEGRIFDEERSENSTAPRRKYVFLTLLTLGVIGIFLILLLGLGLVGGNEQNVAARPTAESSSSASNATTPIVYPPFRNDVYPYYRTGIAEVNSPFYKANLWMMNDPNLDNYSLFRQGQRFDLAILYYATGGQNWTHNDHWLSYDVAECDWYTSHIPTEEYPSICNENGTIIVANMSSNNLQTVEDLPASWYSTRHVRIFDISNNNISGALPDGVAPNIEFYSIRNNNFGGFQSGGMGGISAFPFKVMLFDGNQLIGNSGPIFEYMPHLEILNISNNLHDGQPTHHLQNCTNLTYFGAANNDFSGTLPPEWGTLRKLEEIDFSGNNQLTGTIPLEWQGMESLKRLDLRATQLQGEVPPLFCERQQQGILELLANCSLVDCC